MKSLLLSFALSAVAAASLLNTGKAASIPVVDWGGNYVSTTSVDLNGRAGDYTVPNYGIWKYAPLTRSSPLSGYSAPPGKSATFYWGAYLHRNVNEIPSWRNWSNAFIRDQAGGDGLEFYRFNNMAGVTYSGAAFLSFHKVDFLNGGAETEQSFNIDSSLSVTTNWTRAVTYRFALQSEGVWYVSSASKTQVANLEASDTFSLSGAALLVSAWGVWDPVGGPNGRLGALPVSYDVTGASFDEIEGFGLYIDFHPDTATPTVFRMTNFVARTAEPAVVPEPSVAAIGLVLLAFLTRFRRSFAS